ncbi:hypothetical protein NL533_33365, partial [Klebsiella pneumoniae]|nr:hypothetical protein [Klebsiella pneumoniae]
AARKMVRGDASRYAVPAALKARLLQSLVEPAVAAPARGAVRPRRRWWQTIGLGAALACSLVMTWAVTTQLQTASLDERLPDAIVS